MEINLKEYLMMARKRWWIIVGFVLAAAMLASLYSNRNYRPVYQATAQLIGNKSADSGSSAKDLANAASFGINSDQLSTYKEIMKTPAIMDKVVQRNPDLNMNAEQVASAISVSSLNQTQIMTITAQSASYDKAVRITNAVAEVFRTEIPKILRVDNITILASAKNQANPSPINKKSNQYIVLGVAVALVAAFGIILLLEALDDTLKTDEDIRLLFDAPALAHIPRMKSRRTKSSMQILSRKKAEEKPYAAVH